MFINHFLLVGNPFFSAYSNSDLFGKCIFIGLISASFVCWSLIFYKWWYTRKAKKSAQFFKSQFLKHQLDPLGLSVEISADEINPYLQLYSTLKRQTLDLLRKNRNFAVTHTPQEKATYLSASDIALVESHLASDVAIQTQKLDSNLFILSTIMSLGPFLGLLGTVWGILITFSELQGATAASNQAVLGGISLALATTVLGLVDAIPALIGYNYFKDTNRSFITEMECFCNEMLAAVELHYRQVDLSLNRG